ncbi:cytochrome P450 [Dendrothele bispora CBS 962.96]|uniref:Cytochrome P450 n=1 Tax=Dendrothele bispora (strain CBS 962.96) TaxID=1314807 RepID=A0A4S8LQH8_DENBC|nr:cytochrome P450 [Dendrothele bispora CBS 962.96]
MDRPVAVTVFVALIICVFTVYSWRRRQKLPPGPSGYPIIGNLFDMPAHDTQTWLIFADWAERYGSDISSLTVLGQTFVILNSVEVANEMLGAKSAIYSDRPRLVLTGEMGGWNQGIGTAPYNDRWKVMRKLFHGAIGTPAANSRFDSGKEIEARKLMRNILNDPEHVLDHLRLSAGSTILRDTYGYDVTDEDDLIIRTALEALNQFSRTTSPPYYAVEYFPALKHLPTWFPGAYFKRLAVHIRNTVEAMAQMPFDFTKQDITQGTAPRSFVSSLLESYPEDETIIKWTAESLYSGAADTSVSSIYAGLLAMILYPDVTEKARNEIESVVGSDRLPSFSDRPYLPYVNAFIKELFRWNTVTPLGGPHRSTEQDVHKGYYIPRGTILLANIWKMSHDASKYKDPMKFNPDRFLGPKPEPDPMEFTFGFGRRSCPGIWFADAAVYIGISMILAVFTVTKAIDPKTGEPIMPVHYQLPGTVSHPKPCQIKIQVRNEKAASLIMQAE